MVGIKVKSSTFTQTNNKIIKVNELEVHVSARFFINIYLMERKDEVFCIIHIDMCIHI